MKSPVLPHGAWNCHVHSFDTERYALKPGRAYTPKPALLKELVKDVYADNIMLVQATIEDGYQGLLQNLTDAKQSSPEKNVYGTIYADPSAEKGLKDLSAAEFDALHYAGVRSIRIHGSHGGSGTNVDWVKAQFRGAAQLHPISTHGWSISAQLPLTSWAALEDFLCDEPFLQNVLIIADHNGGARPPDVDTIEFKTFLSMMQKRKLYVKIGALHRRSPDDIRKMRPVVEAFACTGPKFIVWGSDWPHVNISKGLEPSGRLEGVDTDYELWLLRKWLSEAQWEAMMVSNPERLFAA